MTAPCELSLLDAWRAWASGSLGPKCQLFGVQLLFWGRVGKLLQFFAALTIVAEILGAQRLRAFGKSLHRFLSVDDLRHATQHSIKWVLALMRVLTGPRVEDEGEFLRSSRLSRFMFFVAALLFVVVTMRFAQYCGSWMIGVVIAIVFMTIGGFLFTPIVAFLILGPLAVFGGVFDMLVIEPIAWLLERDALDRWVKVTALVLLLIGFHFDMLAS
jgi:hypothetical protein